VVKKCYAWYRFGGRLATLSSRSSRLTALGGVAPKQAPASRGHSDERRGELLDCNSHATLAIPPGDARQGIPAGAPTALLQGYADEEAE
jgi:hypothetical protein